MLQTGEFQERARVLGARLERGLRELVGQGVISFRIRGLWAGVDVDPMLMSGRELCEALLERGVLAKDTHGSTIRLAPPLVATEDDIDILLEALRDALDEGQPAP
jgi:ornithine--oxo-acid transaminase